MTWPWLLLLLLPFVLVYAARRRRRPSAVAPRQRTPEHAAKLTYLDAWLRDPKVLRAMLQHYGGQPAEYEAIRRGVGEIRLDELNATLRVLLKSREVRSAIAHHLVKNTRDTGLTHAKAMQALYRWATVEAH